MAKPVDDIYENAAIRLTCVRYANSTHYEVIIETIRGNMNVV